MPKTIIAGCGAVGSRLGELLARRGDRVVGVRRTPGLLPSCIEPLILDLSDPNALASADLDCDRAVYCAAADAQTESAYHSAYVLGLRNFLERLKTLAPRLQRVIFTSSTGVHGQNEGEWVDEDSPANPTGFTGQKVLEGEFILFDSGLPAVAVRFGGIYSAKRNRLLSSILEGRVPLTRGPVYSNRIHLEDCARSILHLLEMERPESVYLGVDCDPGDRNEVIRWICRRTGAPLPAVDPASTGRVTGKRCRNDRMRASGFEFSYPSFREGYGAMLNWRMP